MPCTYETQYKSPLCNPELISCSSHCARWGSYPCASPWVVTMQLDAFLAPHRLGIRLLLTTARLKATSRPLLVSASVGENWKVNRPFKLNRVPKLEGFGTAAPPHVMIQELLDLLFVYNIFGHNVGTEPSRPAPTNGATMAP
eukprot:4944294-Amphidinium_carterae.2